MSQPILYSKLPDSSIAAPMKIALFTYSTKPRGSVIHTLELAEALHKLGNTVCVYALDKDGQGFDYPLSCVCELIPAKPASTDIDQLIKQRIQEFVDYLGQKELSYDCYHAQDCLSANALAILREKGKIKHFFRTVHHIEDYTSPYLQQCQDRSIHEADLCFCVSDRWQKELQQQYNIHAARVVNGVNIQRFTSDANSLDNNFKRSLGLNSSPVYLTVGGIEPRKNSICLLQAFADVLNVYPNAQLVIAGGATLFDYQSYRNDFLALADQLGITIGQSLILPGVISDEEMPALYRCADAFVFPSIKEGWGLVVLEAIASGIPVITSNQTPFTEFLSDNQALLIDPSSPFAIAQAMCNITQPELARSLVENSQSILTKYTWENSAKMHLKQYEEKIVGVRC